MRDFLSAKINFPYAFVALHLLDVAFANDGTLVQDRYDTRDLPDKLHWALEIVEHRDRGDNLGPQVAKAAADEFGVDLTLTPEKPPVVHGKDGISRKGAGEGHASHYYSLTRLRVAGTLALEGRSSPVTGTSATSASSDMAS